MKNKKIEDVVTGKVIPPSYVFNSLEGVIDKRDVVSIRGYDYMSKYSKLIFYDDLSEVYCLIGNGFKTFMEDGSTKLFSDLTVSKNKFIITRDHSYIDTETKRKYQCIENIDAAKKLGIKEDLFGGVLYNKAGYKPADAPVKYYRFGFPIVRKEDAMKFGEISPTYLISEGKKYTMGIEIETSGGYVPNYIAENLNMKSEYDGSIRNDNGDRNYGGEYVTGVLRGDNGFKHLYKIFSELSKRCSINNTCSLHVHLGNTTFNKETIISIWKVAQMLEAELYSMMPSSRKSRAHCRPIYNVDFSIINKKNSVLPYKQRVSSVYNKIFEIVSLGKKPSKVTNKKYGHPAGDHCGFNTSTPRYWWINFVPVMFNLKGEENYTIEYRMHSATLDFTKAKNWILIVMGILYYSENFKRDVFSKKTLTLEEVMKKSYPGKGLYLTNYINERKDFFSGKKNSSSLAEKSEYFVERELNLNNAKIRDII